MDKKDEPHGNNKNGNREGKKASGRGNSKCKGHKVDKEGHTCSVVW